MTQKLTTNFAGRVKKNDYLQYLTFVIMMRGVTITG